MDVLLDNAPCGFLSFDEDGVIVHCNKTLKKMLAREDEPMEGKSIELILTVSSRIFYNTHFFPLIKLHGYANEIFISLLSKHKEHIPVLVNASRRPVASGYHIDCVLMGVHQRQKYEDQILEAKKVAEEALQKNEELTTLTQRLESNMLELDHHYQSLFSINQDLIQFNKIISHDLQEPIRKIAVFNKLLEKSADEKQLRYIDKINNAIERLRLLTNGLDEYINVGSLQESTIVDLNTILQRALQKVSSVLHYEEFDIQHDQLPKVEGYETQLELLFYHLLLNSIQFREPSTRLNINISSLLIRENIYKAIENRYQYTEHVKITFEDNGRGFEAKYNDYVFGLLKKVHPDNKGLGIGLSLCKKITENHNGRISAASQQGRGTKINIILPTQLYSAANATA